MLNEVKENLLCVRGNCDSEVDQMVLQFPIMADYALLYLENRMVFIAHGHIFNEQNLPMLNNGDILIHGHTHVSAVNEHDTYTYINPGSVSLPKEGTPKSYMIYEDGLFVIKDFDGNEVLRYSLTHQ